MNIIKPFYLDFTEAEINDIKEEIGSILHSGNLILGENTKKFESSFADYVGTRYAVALNTATSALQILCTLKGASGKRVAVPSNTNFASVAAILHSGGVPVFMDMTPEYFCPNLSILQRAYEKYKFEGVMWVHIGGIISPDFQEVIEFCKKKNIFLVEDAAHAHGSRLNGISAGAFGDGGAFSFFPTKVMTTMEGGILVTNSKDEYELAQSFRNQGKRHSSYGGLHYDLGSSWRMSEISAFMGLIHLKKLDRMISIRQNAVNIISKTLDLLKIEYCSTDHMDTASQYKFIVKLGQRYEVEKVKEVLKSSGVICGGGVYEVPCHLQPVFSNISYDVDDLPNTERWCPNHLCPPITSGISSSDTEQIANSLKEIFLEGKS